MSLPTLRLSGLWALGLGLALLVGCGSTDDKASKEDKSVGASPQASDEPEAPPFGTPRPKIRPDDVARDDKRADEE